MVNDAAQQSSRMNSLKALCHWRMLQVEDVSSGSGVKDVGGDGASWRAHAQVLGIIPE